MKTKLYSATIALTLVASNLCAQQVFTEPSGYVSITCLANSETIISTPLALPSSFVGTAVSATSDGNDLYSITLNANPNLSPLPGDLFYIRFTQGAFEGQIFEITNKSMGGVVVVDGGGVDLSSVNNLKIEIVPFWTLKKLFPIGNSTIVPSADNNIKTRRTVVLIPDVVPGSARIDTRKTFYINSTTADWRSSAVNFPVADNVIIWPDSYLIVKHNKRTGPTTFTNAGKVDGKDLVIPLFTHPTKPTDNYVAIPRPITTRLDELGLGDASGVSSAFVGSTDNTTRNRGDTLLVFNNALAAAARRPSATYFYNQTTKNWVSLARGNPVSNHVTLDGAVGFIIKKKAISGGVTSLWVNKPTW